MPQIDTFDKLVSGLPPGERQNLFEKVKGLSALPLEPLYLEDDFAETRLSAAQQFFRLPWFMRIWFYILGFFTSRPPASLAEERRIALVGQKINERTPGLFNYKTGKLLPVFYALLLKLKSASRFFYSAFENGFKKDKGAFFAYLGSLEMASVHSRLLNAVNPDYAAGKNPGASEAEIRQAMSGAVDDALNAIDEEARAAMYVCARALHCLLELASFPFDRMITAFSLNKGLGGYTCFVHSVKEQLTFLGNILFSFKANPPAALLDSLFVFMLQEKTGRPGFDIDVETKALLSGAEEALSVIREFNRRVPLGRVLACAGQDGRPSEIPGGEDWNALYRDYWKREAEQRFGEYTGNRREKELRDSLALFFAGDEFRPLEHAFSETNPEGFPVENAFSLSFLLTFFSSVFMARLNKLLTFILVEGDFVRKENRVEFNESYNTLIRLDETIRKLDSRLSTYGDYGQRYAQARQEMTALAVKRRKIQIVTGEAAEDAAGIVSGARRAFTNMILLLSGILGESDGKYFPLANLARLKENRLWESLPAAAADFRKALEMLETITGLERQ